MLATHSVIYFPKLSKRTTPRKPKPNDKKKPEPKSTVVDWIRNYQFPGKPIQPVPPKPIPGPIQIPPTPDNPPRKPGEKGGVQ